MNNLKQRGAEQQLFNFVTSIPPHVKIDIFRFSNGDDEFPEMFSDKRIRIYSSSRNGTYNPLRWQSLSSCLNVRKYDAMVTVGLGAALLFGRVCAFLNGINAVYSCLNTFENFNTFRGRDGQYFDILNQTVNHCLTKIPGKRIFRFLPNSDRLARKIRSVSKGYPTHTLYNGLKPGEFEAVADYRPDERIQAILARFKGFPSVVQVGTLDDNKNQLFTLRCIEEIRRYVPEVRLLLLGDGMNRQRIRDRISCGGLDRQVIMTGQLSRMDCLYLMSQANLLVLTSQSESFPNVLLEGQALSLPVVTFDAGASSEIVEHGVTGYVVPPADENGFKDAVIRLLTDPTTAVSMGHNGKSRVLEAFNMDNKVKRFLALIEKDLRHVDILSGKVLINEHIVSEP